MQSNFYSKRQILNTGIVRILRIVSALNPSTCEADTANRSLDDGRESFDKKDKEASEPLNSSAALLRDQSDKKLQMYQNYREPSTFRQVFYRQADALFTAAQKTDEYNTYCTFAYQRHGGSRRFLVAQPEMFWRDYINRPPQHRHSYEVIPEGSPCWLYLDLEFKTSLNPGSNGPRMTNTLIDILCSYMSVHCGIHCNKTNVVNLDSTTDEKFSRHLVFSIKDVAFENNLHVGKFVKFVCADIQRFLKSHKQHEILSYYKRWLLEELFVETERRKEMFIDLGVYTRNRTFRIYKSTKWGKRSYLTVSPNSKHIPLRNYDDKELGIFLDSLISYFPNKKDLITVKFGAEESSNCQPARYNRGTNSKIFTQMNASSMYPELDSFVSVVIHPGTIRSVNEYFQHNRLTYTVNGSRYCENIGRWHKSNNILWVVDLNKGIMYQKCSDIDCNGFRSTPTIIPDDVMCDIKRTRNNWLEPCADSADEYASTSYSSCYYGS